MRVRRNEICANCNDRCYIGTPISANFNGIIVAELFAENFMNGEIDTLCKELVDRSCSDESTLPVFCKTCLGKLMQITHVKNQFLQWSHPRGFVASLLQPPRLQSIKNVNVNKVNTGMKIEDETSSNTEKEAVPLLEFVQIDASPPEEKKPEITTSNLKNHIALGQGRVPVVRLERLSPAFIEKMTHRQQTGNRISLKSRIRPPITKRVTPELFFRHRLKHKRVYPCHLCPQTYTFKADLCVHILADHSMECDKEEKFQCDVCGKVMKNRGKLEAHMCRHTGEMFRWPH